MEGFGVGEVGNVNWSLVKELGLLWVELRLLHYWKKVWTEVG